MKIRDFRSISIISFYVAINSVIGWMALSQKDEITTAPGKSIGETSEFSEIENLDYYHLKNSTPQMSLAAEKMRSQGEDRAEFKKPRGVYNYQEKNQTLRYQAEDGLYLKPESLLKLTGDVQVTSDEASYEADELDYFFNKDLLLGSGDVVFDGLDLKTQDKIKIHADKIKANPQAQKSLFTGKVNGTLERKKKYEKKMSFSSQQLQLEGLKSLAHLEGDVVLKRDPYLITAGKADFFLENYNKSLKYFVLNDDVKVTETVNTPTGVNQRKSFSERLEAFGREEKMVLSGAPRVEMGADMIKGYRITIRENVDLVEVEDAMSDMKVKREKKSSKE